MHCAAALRIQHEGSQLAGHVEGEAFGDEDQFSSCRNEDRAFIGGEDLLLGNRLGTSRNRSRVLGCFDWFEARVFAPQFISIDVGKSLRSGSISPRG